MRRHVAPDARQWKAEAGAAHRARVRCVDLRKRSKMISSFSGECHGRGLPPQRSLRCRRLLSGSRTRAPWENFTALLIRLSASAGCASTSTITSTGCASMRKVMLCVRRRCAAGPRRGAAGLQRWLFPMHGSRRTDALESRMSLTRRTRPVAVGRWQHRASAQASPDAFEYSAGDEAERGAQ